MASRQNDDFILTMIESMENLKEFLDKKVIQYNQPNFIAQDPIQIPHAFSLLQDIEIMGFMASILAWGKRITIIKKCKELALLMDNAPYQFILQHESSDLKRFLQFKHRTFNATDALYTIEFFKTYYTQNQSLEDAFACHLQPEDKNIEKALIGFHQLFFSLEDAPLRTRKHIATPIRKSACKRINMFLRWLVRQDAQGVDFGLWKKIKPSQLVCPLDVHVERTARQLKLISRPKSDWQTAVELTENLKKFDAQDPVKYDFALFGLGIENYFGI